MIEQGAIFTKNWYNPYGVPGDAYLPPPSESLDEHYGQLANNCFASPVFFRRSDTTAGSTSVHHIWWFAWMKQ